ncbi:unknown [Prevotella sp. CAG:1058]|nr:unknown [Prevotella sp. CAG:1058]
MQKVTFQKRYSSRWNYIFKIPSLTLMNILTLATTSFSIHLPLPCTSLTHVIDKKISKFVILQTPAWGNKH